MLLLIRRSSLEVSQRHQRRDEDRVRLEPRDLVAPAPGGRGIHLEHNVRGAEQPGGIRLHLRSRGHIRLVGEAGGDARARLHRDLVTGLNEFLAGLGDQRHPPLMGSGLRGYSDAHRTSQLYFGFAESIRTGAGCEGWLDGSATRRLDEERGEVGEHLGRFVLEEPAHLHLELGQALDVALILLDAAEPAQRAMEPTAAAPATTQDAAGSANASPPGTTSSITRSVDGDAPPNAAKPAEEQGDAKSMSLWAKQLWDSWFSK